MSEAAQPALATGETDRRNKAVRRRITSGLKILAFLFVFITFGLPAIAGVRKAIDELSDVEPLLLVSGVGLQFAALLAYAQLTRTALPSHQVSLFTLVRIQLATKTLTNTMPGGSAAGSALGFRLLTLAGVRGADAGFGLATAALGSAVVLNVMLWGALIVSIPLRGVNPLYGTAAVLGIGLMVAAAAVVLALMKGKATAERIVRWTARKLRFDEVRAAIAVRHVAVRLSELMTDPALFMRVAAWAAVNWVLDAASLWVFLRAFGDTPPVDGLIIAFGIANLVAAIPLTPGGLGLVEGVYIPLLTAFGLPRSTVVLGVSTYRLAQFWLPIPLGALSYVSLRYGPGSLARVRRLGGLRKVAVEMAATSESRLEWAERYGHRPHDPTVPLTRSPDSAGAPPPADDVDDDVDDPSAESEVVGTEGSANESDQ